MVSAKGNLRDKEVLRADRYSYVKEQWPPGQQNRCRGKAAQVAERDTASCVTRSQPPLRSIPRLPSTLLVQHEK